MERTVVALIALITLATTLLDLWVWHTVFQEGNLLPGNTMRFSQIARFIRTALLLGFLPAVLQKHLPGKHVLAAAFVLAIVADFFLILRGRLIIGITFFAVMQVMLMIRHLNGFQLGQFRERTYWLSVLIAAMVWLTAMALLRSGLEASGLFLPVVAYGLLLILSVWAAYACCHLERLPLKNARLAFYAMLCFLACDITVGLGAIWEGESHGMLTRALTGLFYGPCLILLGLSGVKSRH